MPLLSKSTLIFRINFSFKSSKSHRKLFKFPRIMTWSGKYIGVWLWEVTTKTKYCWWLYWNRKERKGYGTGLKIVIYIQLILEVFVIISYYIYIILTTYRYGFLLLNHDLQKSYPLWDFQFLHPFIFYPLCT